MKSPFRSAACLRRCRQNPVLTAADVPYDASLVFNAGVVKFAGRYVMLFRNDYGASEEDFRRGGPDSAAPSRDEGSSCISFHPKAF